MEGLPTKLQGKDKEQENKAEIFSYDPVGNRLTGPTTNDVYWYNLGNQLTSDRKHQYQYDRNGNLIQKTEADDDRKTKSWNYFYDFENRLIKVMREEKDEIKTVSFKYDPFGRRIEKKVEETKDRKRETETFTYVYDHEDIIVEYLTKAEDGEAKTETTRYIHGPGIDEPLAIERKGEIFFYHADGLGSITALTDWRQRMVESYTYDSFGNVKRKGDKVKNTFTFTGREWDKEAGLYYYRARYYDAEIGRFTSFDPILHPGNGRPVKAACNQSITYPIFEALKDSPQKLNPFVYVQNNPALLTDPSGLIIERPVCNGEWKLTGSAVTAAELFCACYWQCIQCDGKPGRIGVVLSRTVGGGSACWCAQVPGPEFDCQCRQTPRSGGPPLIPRPPGIWSAP